MIDPKLLRTEPDRLRAAQEARGESVALVDELIAADEARRASIAAFESLRAEQKSLGRQVAFKVLQAALARDANYVARFQHEARAAATIQADHADWPGIQGVQLEGTVQPLSGNAEARARDLYGQKFPLVGKLAQAPAAIVRALAKVRWYRLSTSRLYFIDNTRGFGHREELVLRVGAADT